MAEIDELIKLGMSREEAKAHVRMRRIEFDVFKNGVVVVDGPRI